MNKPPPSGRTIWLVASIAGLLLLGLVWTQMANVSGPAAAPNTVPSAAAASPTELQADDVKALTAEELWQLYDQNEVAAAQEMAGHYVQVSGPIKSIDLDGFDNVVVRFGVNEFDRVSAQMQAQDRDRAAKLSKGQQITVLCSEVQRLLGDPYLDHCQICTATDTGLTCT